MKKQYGITLIALTITIIVILILAGVTIQTLTGENGLLTKAGEAKNASEIAEEKDIISISAIQAQSENKYGNLEENNFREALNANSKTGNKASIIAEDTGSFTVKFESNRYYEVNKNGNISYIENATGEKTLTIQCVNSKNEVLGEYEYTIVTDRYSKLPPTINKYESSEEKIEGEITENKTIQVLYYLICNDDTTLVFTGLDSSGNITTNKNSIVSYMVGDGSSNNSNGLKNTLTCDSVIKIPKIYNNISITVIGQKAFSNNNKIKAVNIGECITSIKYCAFYSCSSLKSMKFTNNSPNLVIEDDVFTWNSNWTEIKVNNENKSFKAIDNILYSNDGKRLILAPRGITGDIKIYDLAEVIEKNAFYCCNKINSVNFNNVKEIGVYAFAHCSSLKNVDLNVETIGNNAFHSSGIETIILGKQVQNIGRAAFHSCSSLKSVTFNNIGDVGANSDVFTWDGNWTEIKVNIDNESYMVMDNILYSKNGEKLIIVPRGMSGDITISSSARVIGKGAFYCNNKINQITIGENINTIEENAFPHCSQLKTIIIDSPAIAFSASNSSFLLENREKIYIKSSITEIGSYINNNYQLTESDKEGYIKYVKK